MLNSSGIDSNDLRDEFAERIVCRDFSALTEEWFEGFESDPPETPVDTVLMVFDAFKEDIPPSFSGFESQLPSALASLLLLIPSMRGCFNCLVNEKPVNAGYTKTEMLTWRPRVV